MLNRVEIRGIGREVKHAGPRGPDCFLHPGDLGTLRYGSEHMNITADPTTPGGLGTFGFDDEGVPAARVPIVSAGVLSGFLTSRETAAKIGDLFLYTYLLPFELASLVLLAAMIGAVVLSRKEIKE